jgi:hypothetical protein
MDLVLERPLLIPAEAIKRFNESAFW